MVHITYVGTSSGWNQARGAPSPLLAPSRSPNTRGGRPWSRGRVWGKTSQGGSSPHPTDHKYSKVNKCTSEKKRKGHQCTTSLLQVSWDTTMGLQRGVWTWEFYSDWTTFLKTKGHQKTMGLTEDSIQEINGRFDRAWSKVVTEEIQNHFMFIPPLHGYCPKNQIKICEKYRKLLLEDTILNTEWSCVD